MIVIYKWLLTKYYEFKYRKVDPDVCCCGSSDCYGDYSHGYVNAKDYHIERAVNQKLKSNKNQSKG